MLYNLLVAGLLLVSPFFAKAEFNVSNSIVIGCVIFFECPESEYTDVDHQILVAFDKARKMQSLDSDICEYIAASDGYQIAVKKVEDHFFEHKIDSCLLWEYEI